MAAFDTIVSVLFVDMGDVVKVWIVVMIDIFDDLPIGRCLIGANGDRAVKTDTFDRLV